MLFIFTLSARFVKKSFIHPNKSKFYICLVAKTELESIKGRRNFDKQESGMCFVSLCLRNRQRESLTPLCTL